ncbi:MAG: hypothetical protein ABFS38_06930 [Bacteroidota bacterium]
MSLNLINIEQLYNELPDPVKEQLDRAIDGIIHAKEKGGKVVVVTGSGPNLHEGVTTLIAELIHKGIIDGVTTSSAVIAHEMAGVLDEVKRVDGTKLGFSEDLLPRGGIFEVTMMKNDLAQEISREIPVDAELMKRAVDAEGELIIKAAGNMAYPMGLRTELLAKEILSLAKSKGKPFEYIAGKGADPKTMLGAGFQCNIPVLVTVPQLVGGGLVGMAIGDSISISERSESLARMLSDADVIIESAVALTQEIHDGPFETYTGHGIWSAWEGTPTFSLKGKTLIRIDLDPNLKKAWDFEKGSGTVQQAIDQGMPKTKLMSIPFRMEMSGFARLEKSIPVIGDIGSIWPVMAHFIAQRLAIPLDFISYPQQSPEGEEMRNWMVQNILPVKKEKLYLSKS